MGLVKSVIKKSLLVLLPLAAAASFVDWGSPGLRLVGLFGRPKLIPLSIIVGGVIGLANLKGMVWAIESMLGTHQANAKLVFLSLVRLFILFAVIILLVALQLVNLVALLIGMSVVFVVMIREAAGIAKRQAKE